MSIWSHNTCFQKIVNGTKIGLLKTSQLLGTPKLQKTGEKQKNKDRQRSVLSRMWKQLKSSTVGSMKQLSLFKSVVFPSGDIFVDSGQISRKFLSWSYVTSKYHHTKISLEYSGLQKNCSYKKPAEKLKDTYQKQTSKEITADIQQWFRFIFGNNSFVVRTIDLQLVPQYKHDITLTENTKKQFRLRTQNQSAASIKRYTSLRVETERKDQPFSHEWKTTQGPKGWRRNSSRTRKKYT